jgi:cytidylate kinase
MTLITITQNFGGDGTAIARKVADGLGIDLFDNRKLQDLFQARGIPSEEIGRFDEKAPGFLDKFLGSRPQVFLDILESVIYEVARKGEGVIVGHGSQMLLRNFDCAFHVRVFSSDQRRAENMAAEQRLSREAALKLIRKRDQEQSGFFNFAFHLEMNDPSLYDLIIHTEKLDLDTAAGLIIQAAGSESIRTCSLKALEAMERLALEKRVHAALVQTDLDVASLIVEVPERGIVHVYGISHNSEEMQKLKAAASSVPGVSNVVSGISVVTGM